MRMKEVDKELCENNLLKALGLTGAAYAASQLRRGINDHLPTYKKGGLRRTTSQICQKVNGRTVCDYGADVGFDLPTIEPPKAWGGRSGGRQPSIDLLNFDTGRNRNNNTSKPSTPKQQSPQQQDYIDNSDPMAKLPPWLRPKKR